MKRWAVIAALLLASCADGPDESTRKEEAWQLRPPSGYLNSMTMEEKSPRDLYDYAASFRDPKDAAKAAAIFGILADTAPDPKLRSNAIFSRGQALMLAGSFNDAYRVFESFQARYPDDDLATLAKRQMMESALQLAKLGRTEGVLGTSSRTGVELLTKALDKFPREDFSDDYHYRLAEFHHERGDLDKTEFELKMILNNPTYRRSASAPRALLLLGRVGLERYGGVYYDHTSLFDAKRAYEQFELDYRRYEDDSEKAAERGLKDLPAMLATARAGLAFVYEKLAEREMWCADYYEKHDRPKAARIYLEVVVKNYPKTKCAQQAAERLKEMEAAQ